MNDYLVHLVAYNKIYLIIGAGLLLLLFLPTKEKISAGTQKALYVFLVIWIICFAYRINTGRNITHLFESRNNYNSQKQDAPRVQGSPFNKYYSNDAGRKPKE